MENKLNNTEMESSNDKDIRKKVAENSSRTESCADESSVGNTKSNIAQEEGNVGSENPLVKKTTRESYTTRNMSFVEGLTNGFKNILKFKGRARRKEFWVFYIAAIFIAVFLSSLLPISSAYYDNKDIAMMIVSLMMMSVCVRRMHDIGWSGWIYFTILIVNFLPSIVVILCYLFLNFDEDMASMFSLLLTLIASIPSIIVGLIVSFGDGEQMTNKYGASPKYILNEELSEKKKTEEKKDIQSDNNIGIDDNGTAPLTMVSSVGTISEIKETITEDYKNKEVEVEEKKSKCESNVLIDKEKDNNRSVFNWLKNFNVFAGRKIIFAVLAFVLILLGVFLLINCRDKDNLKSCVYIEVTKDGRVLHTDKNCSELHKAVFVDIKQLNVHCYYCTKCVSDKQAILLDKVIKSNIKKILGDSSDNEDSDFGSDVEETSPLLQDDDSFDGDEDFKTDFGEY